MGASLLGQHKYAEAEPFLVEGFLGLLEHETQIWDVLRSTQMTNAAGRLVTLYEEWGKPEEATKWRIELPRFAARLGFVRLGPIVTSTLRGGDMTIKQ